MGLIYSLSTPIKKLEIKLKNSRLLCSVWRHSSQCLLISGYSLFSSGSLQMRWKFGMSFNPLFLLVCLIFCWKNCFWKAVKRFFPSPQNIFLIVCQWQVNYMAQKFIKPNKFTFIFSSQIWVLWLEPDFDSFLTGNIADKGA